MSERALRAMLRASRARTLRLQRRLLGVDEPDEQHDDEQREQPPARRGVLSPGVRDRRARGRVPAPRDPSEWLRKRAWSLRGY
jgi:hypothetical protein